MDEPEAKNEPEGMNEMDEFESQLRQAFERRPAPPGLKRRLMEQRRVRRTQQAHSRALLWQRLAASFVVAALLGGGLAWRHAEEQRKGEEARQQVLTALRITNRALNQMNARLEARDRANQQQETDK
jgi:hypothetical protein